MLTWKFFARKLFHPHVEPIQIEREVKAIVKLCSGDANRYIVQVLHHGKFAWSSYYFIDMELCDGDLRDYIYGRMEPSSLPDPRPSFVKIFILSSQRNKQNWSIMEQIASGLDFIHSHGQVHRDLKPANGTYPRISS
jgi:serine/threonine protein kinase